MRAVLRNNGLSSEELRVRAAWRRMPSNIYTYKIGINTNRKTNTTVSAIRYDIHIHEIIILNDKR